MKNNETVKIVLNFEKISAVRSELIADFLETIVNTVAFCLRHLSGYFFINFFVNLIWFYYFTVLVILLIILCH